MLFSCGSDKAKEVGTPVSVNSLLDKLSQNLDTWPAQKVGYQHTMQQETLTIFTDDNGKQVTCNSVETTTENIIEMRDNAVVLYREVKVQDGPNNSPQCATAASTGPRLVLVNREKKEQILEEFRKDIDSGEFSLRGITDLGNNRWFLVALGR